VDAGLSETELAADFAGYQGETIAKKLGKSLPQKYLAWGRGGKAVYLVKTSEARKALIDAKIIKKPEPRRKPEETPEKAHPGKPVTSTGPTDAEITARSTQLAGRILSEYAAEQFESLAGLDDAQVDRPIHDGLRFVAKFLIRDHCSFGHPRVEGVKDTFLTNGKSAAEEALGKLSAAELLAACLRMIVYPVLEDGADFAEELLGWAELDLEGLRETARRELTAVEEKLDKVEVAAPKGKPKRKVLA
jgi:hypothetical protein